MKASDFVYLPYRIETVTQIPSVYVDAHLHLKIDK